MTDRNSVPTIVLASASPYRRALLARLSIPFECADPGVDEAPFQHAHRDPKELVRALSQAKARAVAPNWPGAIVIGSDQCAVIGGVILGKPGSTEAAIAQLTMLSGAAHTLVTGVCVLDTRTGVALVEAHLTELVMRRLNAGQLAHYVRIDNPLKCAGSYRIESAGISLFERISGSDPSAIEGLPLTVVVRMLAALGADILGD